MCPYSFKPFPQNMPRHKCPTCGRMAEVTNWKPYGYDNNMREYKCPYSHFHYRILSKWELEIEKYLKGRLKKK